MPTVDTDERIKLFLSKLLLLFVVEQAPLILSAKAQLISLRTFDIWGGIGIVMLIANCATAYYEYAKDAD